MPQALGIIGTILALALIVAIIASPFVIIFLALRKDYKLIVKYCVMTGSFFILYIVIELMYESQINFSSNFRREDIIGIWKKGNSLICFDSNSTFSYIVNHNDEIKGRWQIKGNKLELSLDEKRTWKLLLVARIGNEWRILDKYGNENIPEALDFGYYRIKNEP